MVRRRNDDESDEEFEFNDESDEMEDEMNDYVEEEDESENDAVENRHNHRLSRSQTRHTSSTIPKYAMIEEDKEESASEEQPTVNEESNNETSLTINISTEGMDLSQKRKREDVITDVAEVETEDLKRKRVFKSFSTLPPALILYILQYHQISISIDEQLAVHSNIFSIKSKSLIKALYGYFPNQPRKQLWNKTFKAYQSYRECHLLWTSIELYCPVISKKLSMHPGYNILDYVPWRHVKNLRIYGSVSPFSLARLRSSKQLVDLCITGDQFVTFDQINNDHTTILPKSLQYLDLSHTSITESGITILFQRCKNLKVVGLSSMKKGLKTPYAIHMMACFASKLRQLELDNNQLTDEVVQTILRVLPQLEFLSISDNPSLTHQAFLPHKNLKMLYMMNHPSLTEAMFVRFSKCFPSLEDLNLTGCSSKSPKLVSQLLCSAKSLKILSIGGVFHKPPSPKINNDQSSTKNEEVKVDYPSLSILNTGLNLSNLKIFRLDNHILDDLLIVNGIASMKNLSTLSLIGCKGLSDSNLAILLAKVPSLKQLSICSTVHDDKSQFTGKGIVDALLHPNSAPLKLLDISACEPFCLSNSDEVINRLLLSHKSLRTLKADGCKLTDDCVRGLDSLFDASTGNSVTSLQSLSFLSTQVRGAKDYIQAHCPFILSFAYFQFYWFRDETVVLPVPSVLHGTSAPPPAPSTSNAF
mmetsp:Transcript_9203/g.13623  ORF Transcript_9203/g.13623 Transcript_9203/m.13623 type:complete len:701 (-) Transcript_9203:1-2103(-)